MSTKTSTQVLTRVRALIYQATTDEAPLELDYKKSAINAAVLGLWPQCKVAKYDATNVVLKTGTYVYTLSTGFTTMQDLGGYAVCQVFLEPQSSDADWLPLRRVTQDLNAGAWRLHLPPEIVEGYVDKKLRVHFYARVPELDWTGEAADVLDERYFNTVCYQAASDLIARFMQGGSSYDTDLYPQIWKYYLEQAVRSRPTDYQMVRTVGSWKEG